MIRLGQHSTWVLVGLMCCLSSAQAADYTSLTVGTQYNGVHQPRYNPWRPQPKQWGYQGNRPDNRLATQVNAGPRRGYQPPRYSQPLSPILARQYEYRNYVQQVSPYYGVYGSYGGVPWWADPVAVPYGPWAMGNGWPGGIW